MTAAVRRHLMAEVPYGVLLSGGLDSSIVAAIAAREYKNLGNVDIMRSYCIGLKVCQYKKLFSFTIFFVTFFEKHKYNILYIICYILSKIIVISGFARSRCSSKSCKIHRESTFFIWIYSSRRLGCFTGTESKQTDRKWLQISNRFFWFDLRMLSIILKLSIEQPFVHPLQCFWWVVKSKQLE